jgi:hypothetical protein
MTRLHTARFVALAATLTCATPSVAEDLEGFTLANWNRMECLPAALPAGAVLKVDLPQEPGTYLGILAPGGRYFSVVSPGNRLEPMPSSTELSNMTVLSIDTASARGIFSRVPEPTFVQPGTYTIMVGTQFETERPIVRGWCRVVLSKGP